MTIWLAILYGFIQGATEFLPVSSSGHLVLFNNIFKTENNFIFFSLLLHLATLFSVVWVLRKEVLYLIKHPLSDYAVKLYLATIPTVLIVLLFKGFFEESFNGTFLPICFMLTAMFLIIVEFISKKQIKPINKKISFIMGIAQGIAVLPGISRSGSTIIAGLMCGGDRKEVSKFSFLMSIPIILASMLYELLDCYIFNQSILDAPIIPTLVAFITAFIVGLVCVNFMLNAIQKIKLYYFSIYLIILSIFSFFIIN